MKRIFACLVLSSSLLMACTSSKSSPGANDLSMPPGAGGNGSMDFATMTSHDLANPSTSNDLATGTSSGDMAMLCSSPAMCTNGSPVCCSRITLTGGTIPNCTPGAVATDCETNTACPTTLNATCSGSEVVRLCKANSDCTEATYNQCCKFMSGGATIHFCANSTLAGLGGGTCM